MYLTTILLGRYYLHRKLRCRKVNYPFAQGHTNSKWQSRDWHPGHLISEFKLFFHCLTSSQVFRSFLSPQGLTDSLQTFSLPLPLYSLPQMLNKYLLLKYMIDLTAYFHRSPLISFNVPFPFSNKKDKLKSLILFYEWLKDKCILQFKIYYKH